MNTLINENMRRRNSDLGRWMSACLTLSRFYREKRVDPLAAKYPGWSPYNYALGNPVNLIDPSGMASEGLGEKDDDDLYQRLLAENGFFYDGTILGDDEDDDKDNKNNINNTSTPFNTYFMMKWNQIVSDANNFFSSFFSNDDENDSQLSDHPGLTKKQMAQLQLNAFNAYTSITVKGQLNAVSVVLTLAGVGTPSVRKALSFGVSTIPFTVANDFYTGKSFTSTLAGFGSTGGAFILKKYPTAGNFLGIGSTLFGIISTDFSYERSLLYKTP